MIRVVLDTNTFISGTFWKGDPYRIIELIEKGKLLLLLSSEILQEYDRIIHNEEIVKKVENHYHRTLATTKILQLAHIVIPNKKFKIIKDDPDDDKFLDVAFEGKATYLISRDKHLLKIKEFDETKILKPEEFLKEYKKLT